MDRCPSPASPPANGSRVRGARKHARHHAADASARRLVHQAAALQNHLRRASVEPYAWVLNKSVLAAGTRDPLLAARLAAVADGCADQVRRAVQTGQQHNACRSRARLSSSSTTPPRRHPMSGFTNPLRTPRKTKGLAASTLLTLVIHGAAGRNRTHDPLVRSQVLYPAELQPRSLRVYLENLRRPAFCRTNRGASGGIIGTPPLNRSVNGCG